MHIISIIAYTTVLITILTLEFTDPSWTLYLHSTRTVSHSGVFNYTLQPNQVMYYNLTMPLQIILDGMTIGTPIGVFSPVLVAAVALFISILANTFAIIPVACGGPMADWFQKVGFLWLSNVTKLVMVVLVFTVCGMRDVGSIMIVSGLQVSIGFMYTILHNANARGFYDQAAVKPDNSKQVEVTNVKLQESKNIVRFTLFLALAFQYAGLGVVMSGNIEQHPSVWGAAAVIMTHDLLYYLVIGFIITADLQFNSSWKTSDAQATMGIFFDWLINVPIPLMLYLALHSSG